MIVNTDFSENNNYTLIIHELKTFFDSEQVFLNLYTHDLNAIWLDSSLVVEGFSRFSFMGGSDGPLFYKLKYDSSRKTLIKEYKVQDKLIKKTLKESIFDYLKKDLIKYHIVSKNIPFNFNCGFVGYLGYEMRQECGSTVHHKSSNPNAVFLFVDRIIAFDHLEKKTYLLCLVEKEKENVANTWFSYIEKKLENLKSVHKDIYEDICLENYFSSVEFELSRAYNTYMEDIKKCLKQIYDGNSYEICLTNKINAQININPILYYLQLRKLNSAPYGAFLKSENISIASSSPERFMHIDKERFIECKPMKGTIKRGTSKAQDNMLRNYLKNDEKTKAENIMICDLVRNDLGIVCEIGSVEVLELMKVETYATVHQMISTIRGKILKDLTAIDCIKALFPAGSMTGAPKLSTISIIDNLEKEARGIYSGAIGYLSLNGSADFNIVIRTAVITPDHFSVGVGGAITALSDPQKEFDEILLKGKALLDCIKLAHRANDDPEFS